MVFQFARDAYYGSNLYHRSLCRRPPAQFFGINCDPRPGDPTKGVDLVNGRFLLAARTLDLGPHPWDVSLRSARAFTELHGFSWLKDLAALTGDDAKHTAAALTRDWIQRWDRWHAAVWEPGIIGARLAAWSGHIEFLAAAPGGAGLRNDVMLSAACQARHLAGCRTQGLNGEQPFSIAAGLIAAGVAMPELDNLVDAGLNQLSAAAKFINTDGGHLERSPEVQAAVLTRLVECRRLLKAGRIEAPPFLDDTILSMASALKTMMHGDGGLALFNGGTVGRAGDISAILAAAGAKGTAPASLPDTGFERLSAGAAVIIADRGAGNQTPQENDMSRRSSAGALSFEMSIGRHRMIVNCGAHPDETTEWAQVLRTTAAHSTLSVNDTDALPSKISPNEAPGTTGRRNERLGSQLVQLSHDGYRKGFGIVHNRDLYLSKDGDDFRGKEVLVGGAGAFAIRFHLHPDVSASLLEGGSAILVKFGKGQGWRFRSDGAETSLEESVYLGDPARPRRCQQIVLRGETTGGETVIRWSFLSETR